MIPSNFVTPRLVLAGLVLSLAACGTSGEKRDVSELSETEAATMLRQRFPEQAPIVLAQEEGFFAGETGISLAPPGPAGRWRDLDMTLPHDGADAVHMRVPGGFSVRVREVGILGAGEITERTVAYRRVGGTSFWTATPGGYEEWLHLSGVRPGQAAATWDIEGATVRQQGEEVEVVDESGVAKIRVSAPVAYAAGGGKVGVKLRGDGARIELYVESAGEVLVDPVWMGASSMSTVRSSYTATRLANGKVLVAGGVSSTGYVASAEVYNPSTNSWSPAGTMSAPRAQHAAVLLPSGKVLVAGGWNEGVFNGLNSAEEYDPSTNGWVPVAPMNVAHFGLTATLLPNGKVLIVGSGDQYQPTGWMISSELYDPSTKSWSLADAMDNQDRTYSTATLLGDGRVFVAGTYETDIYNPWTNTWAVGPDDGGRISRAAVLLQDGRVLLTGGWSLSAQKSSAGVDIYDPVADTMVSVSPMAESRHRHTATLLQNGKVLVAGGAYSHDGDYIPRATAELFDPVSLTWAVAGSMSVARDAPTATLLANGKVLVAGGVGLASAELYTFIDPLINSSCGNVPGNEAHQPGFPLHAPGPCPAAPAFTPGDASLACGGTKVKYHTYACQSFPDGTHGWTSYYGCCPSTCSGTGITFETRRFLGSPLPSSSANAVYLFNHLAAGGVGYGATALEHTASFSNHGSIPGGTDANIASHLAVSFVIPADRAGVWTFRLGADYGFGGALLVDWDGQSGTELESYWKALHPNDGIDFFWGGTFSDPDVLQGSVNLGPGLHKIEAYGFENGNDGSMRLELMAPGTGSPANWLDPAWHPITSNTLELCGDPCVPGATRCADGAAQTCGANRQWSPGEACRYACVSGQCVGPACSGPGDCSFAGNVLSPSCVQNGSCNPATGHCALRTTGTLCGEPMCTDSVFGTWWRCESTGECAAHDEDDCTPYRCVGLAMCDTGCGEGDPCAPGHTCDLSTHTCQ